MLACCKIHVYAGIIFLLLRLRFVNFQVINDRFGIVEGLMTTVHSITGGYSYNLMSFLCVFKLINFCVLFSNTKDC